MGNKKRVREISRRLDALQTAVQEHLYRKTIEASRAWIDLQLGDKGKLLVSWLQKGDFQKSGLLYSAWGCLYIVYGRYLLLQKDYLPLLGQLREFEAAARSFNNFLLSIYAAVYSAAAQDLSLIHIFSVRYCHQAVSGIDFIYNGKMGIGI